MKRSSPWPAIRRNLVAILRGLNPEEAAEIGHAIFDSGIEAIEIPLNSPDPFVSIERLASELPDTAVVGAGTVLGATDVERLHDAGGRLMVSPNVDLSVLEKAHSLNMITMPGVFTATEALLAVACGATALKFFPASVLGIGGIAAIKAVLPKDAIVGAVGGVSETDFSAYRKVGVETFGLGSSLFKPGASAEGIARKAAKASAEWDRVFADEAAV